MEEKEKVVPPNTILSGYRGSIVHGTYRPNSHENSIDDKDVMTIFLGGKEHYFGLHQCEVKELWIKEYDCVQYEVRKFVRLLLKANPNVLSLLWLQPEHYIKRSVSGLLLIDHRDLFTTKKIYHSFTGYAYSQLKRMVGGSYKGYMGEKRKQLVDKFGYDTKNASHLIRLLRMGIEYLREGVLHVFRKDASQLLEIKDGAWSFERVQREATILFNRAEKAYDECKLPSQPDHKKAEDLLINIIDIGLTNHSQEFEEG